MFLTHHMNPLFLGSQFPELVRTYVNKTGKMAMICTSEEENGNIRLNHMKNKGICLTNLAL